MRKTVILYYTILYYTILYYTILYYTILYAQDVPQWLFNKSLTFPSHTYISAVGVGRSANEAKDDAISQLALYFNSSVSVNKKSGSVITERDRVNKSRYAESDILITSEAALPPVSCTAPFFDSSKNEWLICAFINKKEAAAAYVLELDTGIKTVNQQLQNVQTSSLSFLGLKIINGMRNTAAALEKTQEKLMVLDAEQGKNYSSAVSKLTSQCRSLLETIKNRLHFLLLSKTTLKTPLRIRFGIFLNRKDFLPA